MFTIPLNKKEIKEIRYLVSNIAINYMAKHPKIAKRLTKALNTGHGIRFK